MSDEPNTLPTSTPEQIVVHEEGNVYVYNADNQLHRSDGPAVIYTDGSRCWYQFGKLHRLDGPAIEDWGQKMWYVDGLRHRDPAEGPAVIWPDGRTEYWVRGRRVEVSAPSGVMTDEDGNRTHHDAEGLLHRSDGPAMEMVNGDKFWWCHGELHRMDGPAIDRADGYRAWFVNGLRHRIGGPAVVTPDGTKEYWVDGEQVSKAEAMNPPGSDKD